MTKPIIGYCRVSTDKQGRSGLGLEGQEAALAAYASHTGGAVLATYVEVESGKRNDRPKLARALAHARRSRAQLVVAKLDRLSRNVAFLSALLETDVDFVCCDNPHANRLTIHILAAVAEDEARRISERTKAALAAAKRRGVLLGASRPECCKLSDEARRRGARLGGAAVMRKAIAAYADLVSLMHEWRDAGLSQQAIAVRLNELGHRTRRDKSFGQGQVRRVLQRSPRHH